VPIDLTLCRALGRRIAIASGKLRGFAAAA
jgi:hypothetical protein